MFIVQQTHIVLRKKNINESFHVRSQKVNEIQGIFQKIYKLETSSPRI